MWRGGTGRYEVCEGVVLGGMRCVEGWYWEV